jgi:hypothetical protein
MSATGDGGDTEMSDLFELCRAIATGEGARAARLLSAAPALAQEPLGVGASRESPSPYFFERIRHYVYVGDTALHVAAAAYDVASTTALLANGANPSARNRRGAEPLHYAADGVPGASAWNPEAQQTVIRLLIKAGADPNVKDKSGVAPLHRAVRARCAAAVRSLLENGADPGQKNQSGSTPLGLASQNTGRSGSGSVEARTQQEQIIQLLRQHVARAT